MGRLQDKIVIITGGAAGIGLTASELFAREGAKLLVVDLSSESLEEAKKVIGTNNVSYFSADVTKKEDNERMVAKAVELYGGLDVLIANAGVMGSPGKMEDITPADLDFPFSVNVKGVLLGTQASVPEMRKRGKGSIVVTSSIGATRGGMIAYCTSKHAVTGLARSLAKELAPENIRVNTVNPGPVNTGIMLTLPEAEKERLVSGIPMKRMAEAHEIAEAMLFMASDSSSCMTGTVTMLDGGESAT